MQVKNLLKAPLANAVRRFFWPVSLGLAGGLLIGVPAISQSWQHHESRTSQGLHALSMSVQKHEFALQISCDESGWDNSKVKIMFFGPALPRLNGVDGDTAELLLHFNKSGVDSSTYFTWVPYYFDGGLGDQAWIGDIEINGRFIKEFGSANEIDILNMDMELIYRFPAKGSSAAAKKIWPVCGINPKYEIEAD